MPQLDSVYDDYYDGDDRSRRVVGRAHRQSRDLCRTAVVTLEKFASLIRNTSRADYFGYDAFGRRDQGSGLEAPRHPVLASAFFQDKIEYRDLIVNAGLRWDYYDVDSYYYRFKDPQGSRARRRFALHNRPRTR